MHIFNLILVILILFILFTNHFNQEINQIENNKNKNNQIKVEEPFENHNIELRVETQMNDIGKEFKNTIVRNYQVNPKRIVKAIGNLLIEGNKKKMTGTLIIKPPTDFQVFNDDLKNKELQGKIKNDIDNNKFKFRMKIDGKIISTKMKHLFKDGKLYLKFNIVIV